MTLAEELAKKCCGWIATRSGTSFEMAHKDAVIAAINEAIEKCAVSAELSYREREDNGFEPMNPIEIASRIRTLKG